MIEIYDPDQLETETTYYCQVDCKNEAGTVSGPVWSFTTGINTLIDKTSGIVKFVEIFPNPASGIVNIKPRNRKSLVRVSIINQLGVSVLQKYLTQNFSGSIDVSDILPGLYFINIRFDYGDVNSSLIMIK